MRAMILAAGLGTRLRPLTDDRPKALVEVAGRPLLEIALSRLRSFGVHDVVINVHHFAEKVADFLRYNHDFGMRIALSREEILLDTGGGLKNAAWFFLDDPARLDEPFLLHNVDVISNIDFAAMLHAHTAAGALATLAVQDRPSSRHLLFDSDGQLCGRRASAQQPELIRPVVDAQALAFSGIHILSPRLLGRIAEGGAFSIIASYLSLAAHGETIRAFRADQYYWRDLGRPADLIQAARDLETGLI